MRMERQVSATSGGSISTTASNFCPESVTRRRRKTAWHCRNHMSGSLAQNVGSLKLEGRSAAALRPQSSSSYSLRSGGRASDLSSMAVRRAWRSIMTCCCWALVTAAAAAAAVLALVAAKAAAASFFFPDMVAGKGGGGTNSNATTRRWSLYVANYMCTLQQYMLLV